MRKSEYTKNAIIASALRLLRQNGKVTVKEISEDAGVNVAAINYHFTDKETLLSVVIRRLLADLKKIAENLLLATPETLKSTLSVFLDDCYRFCTENLNVINFLLMPENKHFNGLFMKFFFQTFSIDSDICYKFVQKLAQTRNCDENVLKARYMEVLSALSMPFLTMFDFVNDENIKTFFPLSDPLFRQNYVNEVANTISR